MFLKAKNEKPKFNFKTQIGNAWNLDLHRVKMAVMHLMTQFTHVSRHFGVYNWKQTKFF